jgi:predicted helicase
MVSTNPSDIDGFFRFISGKKVVFSTYQSLPSVLASKVEFDIIISDEAHRTAGMSKNDIGLFNLVHSKELKSKLKLFQTASPKVFKEDLLDIVEEEEDVFAFDMNDENLYGKIVYEMTLGEAIDKKLLCDYRIIAVGVNDEELEEHLNKRTYVTKGISADEAAAPIAIHEIFNKLGTNHMISFHSRLSLADMTSKELNKLGIYSEPVKGTMSTQKREKAFERFKMKKKAVLTNAFALQEGIDIKKVDSIFFSSPKSSTISIVQAIGRALRLDPENPNKIAAIIVPIYATGNPNEKVNQSIFKGLYQLVSSISAVDYRVRAYVEGFTEGKGERGENKPIDQIKLADFERLDFVNFSIKLRNAFVYGALSRKRKTFEENLDLYKDFI